MCGCAGGVVTPGHLEKVRERIALKPDSGDYTLACMVLRLSKHAEPDSQPRKSFLKSISG